jgi:replicative DNA helicase
MIWERRHRNIANNCQYWIQILDDYLWWIIENELVVIWAWSWIWKSELSWIIATANAMKGKKVALLSLEWDIGEIAYRYFQQKINKKLPEHTFIRGPEYRLNLRDVYKTEQEVFYDIPKEMDNIYIFDKSFIPNREKLLWLMADIREDVDMYIIDHLHYLDYGADEYNGISEIIRAIKETTEIIKKPVIVVSHLSRKFLSEKRLPNKNDLHWSSNIEKNANTVILLAPWDLDPYIDVNNASSYLRWTKIIVDKNRTGMPVPAIFDTTFDLRTKEYISWEFYSKISSDDNNRITEFDKITFKK